MAIIYSNKVNNDQGAPALFESALASFPTTHVTGRLLVATDTFALYRDNGTGYDLIGAPGTGTVTGNGTSGQVVYWSGASTVTGNNSFFWDAVNQRLGLNTTTPGAKIDIHGVSNTLVILNNTTTADSLITFQNQNVNKWRAGNSYNANANDYVINDVLTATNVLKISHASLNVTWAYAQITNAGLTVANAGLPLTINDSISGDNKILFQNNGVAAGYLGANTVNCFIANNSSGTPVIYGTQAGVLNATSFTGAGTGLTGMANSLSIGGVATSETFTTVTARGATSTGNITVNGTAFINGALAFQQNNPGVGIAYGVFNNAGGNLYIGISSAVPNSLVTGAGAYSSGLYNTSGNPLFFGTAGIARVIISNSGTSDFQGNQVNTGPLNSISGLFNTTLGINGVADNVKSGTYTPTVTNGVNISASSVFPLRYLRIDKNIIVSGAVQVTVTATGSTSFNLSLPFASNFVNTYEAAGSGSTTNGLSTHDTVSISADGVNDAFVFDFNATVTSTQTIYFTVQYTIL